jgi:outer membrane protein
MMKPMTALILALSLTLQVNALASDAAPSSQAESPWRLGVALGYGIRSNPLAQSDDIPIIVNLDVAWFGKRWFFDNGDLGFTLLDDERFTIDLIGRYNSDRVFFSWTNTRFITVTDGVTDPVLEEIEIPDRDFAVELGVELLADGEWGSLQVTAFHDVSATHDGLELYADYGYAIYRQRWFYRPSLGISWKSGKLNDYYWGVREDEANSLFPAYEPGAGVNAHARLLAGFQINRNWAFIAVGEFERINSEAAASPIVEEQNVWGVFAGFKYEY